MSCATPLPLDKRYDGSKFPGKNCLYLVANLKKIKSSGMSSKIEFSSRTLK